MGYYNQKEFAVHILSKYDLQALISYPNEIRWYKADSLKMLPRAL